MSTADDIKEFGYARVAALAPEDVGDILKFLTSMPVYPDCHVKHGAGAAVSWEERWRSSVVCWDMHDVICAPYLLEHALRMTGIAAEHLGVETPLLYSINAFWSRPGEEVRPDIQDWHRDADDTAFIPLFVYLTDVGDDGAQQVRGPQGVRTITGPCGTSFFSNTMLEHRGLRPKTMERRIWWARWGVSDPPPSYNWDQLQPMDKALLGHRYPTDPRLQQSIRLVAS